MQVPTTTTTSPAHSSLTSLSLKATSAISAVTMGLHDASTATTPMSLIVAAKKNTSLVAREPLIFEGLWPGLGVLAWFGPRLRG